MSRTLALLLIGLIASPVLAQDEKQPTHKQLVAQLRAKTPKRRIAAIEGLTRLKSVDTLSALGKVMAGDVDPSVRMAAAQALVAIDLESSVPLLKEGLGRQAEPLRLFVVERLGSLADTDLTGIFRQRLSKDKSSKVRGAALEALLLLTRDSDALAAVFDALGDKQPALGERALSWIAEAIPAGGRRHVLPVADKARGKRLALALSALSPYGQLADAQRFVAGLNNKSEAVRTVAYEALQTYGEALAFDPKKPVGTQQQAIEAWGAWWKKKAATLVNEGVLLGKLVEYADSPWQEKRKLSRQFKAQLDLALRALGRGISHKEKKVRLAAAELAERIGSDVLLGALIKQLGVKKEDKTVRRQLVGALAAICARQEGLTEARRDAVLSAVDSAYQGADMRMRQEVVRAIAIIGPERGAALLSRVLREDADPRLRADAAGHLGRKGFSQALGPLGKALVKDKEASVRAAAARGLARVEGPAAMTVLLSAYPTEKDDSVRADMLWGVRESKDDQVVPHFLAALRSDNLALRSAGNSGLKKFSGQEMGFLAHTKPADRVEGVEKWAIWWRLTKARRDLAGKDEAAAKKASAVLIAGGEEALPALQKLIDEAQRAAVKRRVIAVLSQIKGARAAWQLTELLSDSDVSLRIAAIDALAELGEKSVSRLMAAGFRGSRELTEKMALAGALTRLGAGASVRDFLIQTVDDQKMAPQRRQGALGILCQSGEVANLPLLRDVLAGARGKNIPRSREAAILGLGRMDDATARDRLLTLAGGSAVGDAVAAIDSLRKGRQSEAAAKVMMIAKKSDSDPVRVAACRYFQQIEHRPVVPYLTQLITDEKTSEGLLESAVEALGSVGAEGDAKTVIALAGKTQSADGVRSAAARAALSLDPSGSWNRLSKLVGPKAPRGLVLAVVEGTVNRPGTAWLKRLVGLLEHGDASVARAAQAALERRSGMAHGTQLVKWQGWVAMCDAVDTAMRELDLKAKVEQEQSSGDPLAKLGPEAVDRLLEFAEGNGRVASRVRLLEFIGQHGTAAHARRVARLAASPGPVGLAALQAYAALAGTEALDDIVTRHDGATGVDKAVLAGAIYRLTTGERRQAILREAATGLLADEQVASAVLKWLAAAVERDRAQCSHELLELAEGASPAVRAQALAAYAAVADRRELARMLRWLSAPDEGTRIHALGAIKPHAPKGLTFDPTAKEGLRTKALTGWTDWWAKARTRLELGGLVDDAIDGIKHGAPGRRQLARAALTQLLQPKGHPSLLKGHRQLILDTVQSAIEVVGKDPRGEEALARLVDISRVAINPAWSGLYQSLALSGAGAVRRPASRALRDLALTDLATYAELVEKSDDPQVQLNALMALNWSDKGAKKPLMDRLAGRIAELINPPKQIDRQAQLSAEAMGLAGKWRLDGVAGSVSRLLESKPKEPIQRQAAATALGRMGLQVGISALIELLGDSERLVREAAFSSLTHLTGAGSEASGEGFGYQPAASAAKRNQAQKEWQRWWSREKTRHTIQKALTAHLKAAKPELATLLETLRKSGAGMPRLLIERLLSKDSQGRWQPNPGTPRAERVLLTKVLFALDLAPMRMDLLQVHADPDPAVRKAAASGFFEAAGDWVTSKPEYSPSAPRFGLARQASLIELAWEKEHEARTERDRGLGLLSRLLHEVKAQWGKLSQLSTSENAKVRQALALYLAHHKGGSAPSQLVGMLADKDKMVRSAAASSLESLTGSKHKDSAGWKGWLKENPGVALKSPTPERQLADLATLRALGRTLVGELGAQIKADDQPDTGLRHLALLALGLVGSQQVLTPLVDAMEDDNALNRREANELLFGLTGESFGYRPGEDAIARADRLIKWRKWIKANPTFFEIQGRDRKKQMALQAEARSLLMLADRGKLDTLWSPMASDVGWIRRAAYEAFTALHGPLRARPALRMFLYDNPNKEQRQKNLEGLKKDWLAELAERKQDVARGKQLDQLHKLAGGQLAFLQALAQAKAPFTRRLAAALAAGVPAAGSAKLLFSLLTDEAAGVREEALAGLRALSGKPFGYAIYPSSDRQQPEAYRQKAYRKWKAWVAQPGSLEAPSWSDAHKSERLARIAELMGHVDSTSWVTAKVNPLRLALDSLRR